MKIARSLWGAIKGWFYMIPRFDIETGKFVKPSQWRKG